MKKSFNRPIAITLLALSLTLSVAQATGRNAPLTPQVGTGKSLQAFSVPRAHPNRPAPIPPPPSAAGLAHVSHPGMGTPPHHMHRPHKGAQ